MRETRGLGMPLDRSPEPTRRRFLAGLFAAPAIVRASSLMPVRAFIIPSEPLVVASTGPLGGYSLAAFPDLLLPGLRRIEGNYASMVDLWPRLWEEAQRAA